MLAAPVDLVLDALLVLGVLVAVAVGVHAALTRSRGATPTPARPVSGSELARRMLAQLPRR